MKITYRLWLNAPSCGSLRPRPARSGKRTLYEARATNAQCASHAPGPGRVCHYKCSSHMNVPKDLHTIIAVIEHVQIFTISELYERLARRPAAARALGDSGAVEDQHGRAVAVAVIDEATASGRGVAGRHTRPRVLENRCSGRHHQWWPWWAAPPRARADC